MEMDRDLTSLSGYQKKYLKISNYDIKMGQQVLAMYLFADITPETQIVAVQ